MAKWLVSTLFFISLCTYAMDQSGRHYVKSKQINTQNVTQLHRAWVYKIDEPSLKKYKLTTAFVANPVLHNKKLYFCTPKNRVLALNAKTGKMIWQYDPNVNFKPFQNKKTPISCAGVSVWTDKTSLSRGFCSTRVYASLVDGRIIALDASSGIVCFEFGTQGSVNLNDFNNFGLGKVYAAIPPAVYKNVLIVAASPLFSGQYANTPDGIVRALDASTGNLLWSWDPIPLRLRNHAGDGGVRAPISVDHALGLVYLPTGSPSPMYYGGSRTLPIPDADAVVALKAETGEPIWNFQTVHHDIWNYNLSSEPALITVRDKKELIPALIQVTKTGYVFLLRRDTGEALSSVEEQPAPLSYIQGELTAKTQPASLLPRFAKQMQNGKDLKTLSFLDRLSCRRQLKQYRNDGLFTAPSTKGSVILPYQGNDGVWGGVAFEPISRLLVINNMNYMNMVRLIPRFMLKKYKKQHPNTHLFLQEGSPYAVEQKILRSFLGTPCGASARGTLTAIDVDQGKQRWQIPITNMKTKWNAKFLGGPLVTAGGLVFLASPVDDYLSAYNLWTGALLWRGSLPHPAEATPISYTVDGNQYLVVATGGARESSMGNHIVAFSLK